MCLLLLKSCEIFINKKEFHCDSAHKYIFSKMSGLKLQLRINQSDFSDSAIPQ